MATPRDRYHPVASTPACLRASATTSCDRGPPFPVAPHAWLVVSLHRGARVLHLPFVLLHPLAGARAPRQPRYLAVPPQPNYLHWLSSASGSLSVSISDSSGKLLRLLDNSFFEVCRPRKGTAPVPPSDRRVDAVWSCAWCPPLHPIRPVFSFGRVLSDDGAARLASFLPLTISFSHFFFTN